MKATGFRALRAVRVLLTAALALIATDAFAGAITLYEHADFNGRQMTLRDALPNFDGTGFNDIVSSVVVHSGLWELCTDAGFRGECIRLSPGDYRQVPPSMNDRISSAREVHADYAPPPPPPPPPYYGRPRVTLYEQPGFGGRSFTIEGNVVSNFDQTGFNDRASSMRVEGGYWLFCTDAYFEGTCRTFGPGDYSQLPWEVSNRISSGRRISENYPYSGPPNWGPQR